ncbi:MAG: metallophosphoesterase, partial [Patescibacteria group bacterium]|nr:metallophosphoesterase [Patescibacteria group bacterium]
MPNEIRMLVTADWQTEFANLDQCERAAKDVLRICAFKKLTTVAFAGDLKRAYNPVDVRVTRFWLDFISRLRKRNLEVLLVLGNHDRVGMYADASNWLPILRRAGARVFDRAKANVLPGISVLPFCSSVEKMRRASRKLAAQQRGSRGVLLFHGDVHGCLYNQTFQSKAAFRVADFEPAKYLAVIGGHVHLPQWIEGRVGYCGSPFCTDWGEANQRKCFVVVIGDKIERIRSSQPGWYDESVKGFYPPSNWKGARVRIAAVCRKGDDYAAAVNRARGDARAKYKGAEISVVLRVKDDQTAIDAVARLADSDEVKIKRYVERAAKDEMKKQAGRLTAYLNWRLQEVSGSTRQDFDVRFLWAEAENFLSFRNV